MRAVLLSRITTVTSRRGLLRVNLLTGTLAAGWVIQSGRQYNSPRNKALPPIRNENAARPVLNAGVEDGTRAKAACNTARQARSALLPSGASLWLRCSSPLPRRRGACKSNRGRAQERVSGGGAATAQEA